MKNVRAVVLAAGEGTRMRSSSSKLLHLHPMTSQALVRFAVNACVESGIGKTIVVVGYQAEKVKSILGEEFHYVHQKRRLGTGDALRQTVSLLKDFEGELVVLPGDAPFITASMLVELIQRHQEAKPVATVLTALLPDPSHYGRIVRNGYKEGYRQIKKIVESKDATSEELEIKEVNSGIYCFDNQKLLPILSRLDRSNRGGEYYLTDVVELLNKKGLRVEAMKANDPQVVLGVNTPEELRRAWRILGKKRNLPSKLNGEKEQGH